MRCPVMPVPSGGLEVGCGTFDISATVLQDGKLVIRPAKCEASTFIFIVKDENP